MIYPDGATAERRYCPNCRHPVTKPPPEELCDLCLVRYGSMAELAERGRHAWPPRSMDALEVRVNASSRGDAATGGADCANGRGADAEGGEGGPNLEEGGAALRRLIARLASAERAACLEAVARLAADNAGRYTGPGSTAFRAGYAAAVADAVEALGARGEVGGESAGGSDDKPAQLVDADARGERPLLEQNEFVVGYLPDLRFEDYET